MTPAVQLIWVIIGLTVAVLKASKADELPRNGPGCVLRFVGWGFVPVLCMIHVKCIIFTFNALSVVCFMYFLPLAIYLLTSLTKTCT